MPVEKFRSDLLRQVLDSAPDAILVASAAGHILYVNGQAEVLFGFRAADLVGQELEVLIPEQFRTRHRRHVGNYTNAPRLRPMGQRTMSLLGRRADGQEFPVEIHLAPATSDGTTVVVATVRDVTERLATAQALQEAREIAEKVARAKGQFLAAASHDLRQPLQSLRMLNASLRRVVTDERLLPMIDAEAANIDRMASLVESLLNVAKIESGTLRPEPRPVSVTGLLHHLRDQFATQARNRGLALVVDSPVDVTLNTDLTLLEGLLANLVSNAVKYTLQGQVTLGCAVDDRGVRIGVHDTGPGIPVDKLQSIFDDFVRLEAGERQASGFGLGLGIVRRLGALLGVEVTVASQPGAGSIFTVHAGHDKVCSGPGESADAKHPASTAAAEPEPGQLMLLVDDDAGVRAATELFFAHSGYRVISAGSADEALAAMAAATAPFDLIVTDNHLGPGLTGAALLPLLRAKAGRDVPTIIVTGDTSGAVEKSADAHTRIMLKPVEPEELLRTAAALVRLSAGCSR